MASATSASSAPSSRWVSRRICAFSAQSYAGSRAFARGGAAADSRASRRFSWRVPLLFGSPGRRSPRAELARIAGGALQVRRRPQMHRQLLSLVILIITAGSLVRGQRAYAGDWNLVVDN